MRHRPSPRLRSSPRPHGYCGGARISPFLIGRSSRLRPPRRSTQKAGYLRKSAKLKGQKQKPPPGAPSAKTSVCVALSSCRSGRRVGAAPARSPEWPDPAFAMLILGEPERWVLVNSGQAAGDTCKPLADKAVVTLGTKKTFLAPWHVNHTLAAFFLILDLLAGS